jgi:dihydroxyacid dehydratase/phosphogluconate dehydratase
MKYRSGDTTQGIEKLTHRALYKSMGYTTEDLDKPMIGIANAWSTVVPGHFNLRQVSAQVKEGIRKGGVEPRWNSGSLVRATGFQRVTGGHALYYRQGISLPTTLKPWWRPTVLMG